VSEAAIHDAIARARAGARGTADPAKAPGSDAATPPAPDEATVRAALADVPDPEIPVLSVVDLGIVDRVEIRDEDIRVTLMPTFVGCPALDVIRADVERRLGTFGRPVEVRFDYRIPWSSDRITPEGRAKLRAAGFAPPMAVRPDEPVLVQLGTPVTCPNCGSRRTVLENAFGPTLCRAIYHCTGCRQPFESFKPV
jgi:ring-1,2-phenylacetyl-CoA epoxidase subunit PaaD